MAKAGDKKVVSAACGTLVRALSNLWESHRERKFRNPQTGKPLPRAAFCQQNNLVEGTVSHIETGRVLGLHVAQLRKYLAVTHGRGDAKFAESVKKVYDGLKELDDIIRQL